MCIGCYDGCVFFVFFFNDTATTEIYTLSLHDALPIACETEAAASQTPSICPPIASVSAGAAPRYPTSVTSIPAACAKLLQIRKFDEPTPAWPRLILPGLFLA